MRLIDRIFGWILAVGAVLHSIGSYLGYKHEPMTLLWALCASLAALLVAAINLLRAGRPTDRPVAWIALVGSLAWAVAAFTFGALIGNLFDPRALIHGIAALALAGFSARTLFAGQVVSSV